MKKALLLAFLLLTNFIFAQTPTDSGRKKTIGGSDNRSSKDEELNKKSQSDNGSLFEKEKPVRIPHFETPPVIDGKLDDAIWRTAAVFKDFLQVSPGDNIAPSKQTIAYLGYDEKNLYLAFYCYDDPEKIRATVAKRDDVFGEDNVRVYLDTYNDRRRAYVLGFNPFGIQQDGVYTENQGTDYSVDVVMESKGIIVSDGWTLEVKIPFKSLRYAAGKGKMWGLHIVRNIDRFNDELDSWMPQNRNITGLLIQAGKITGLENIKIERTLEIVPSITASNTGNRARTIPQSVIDNSPIALIDPGRFVTGNIKPDLGVTIKFNFTPNVTLDAAINPDFAEIEADAPVVLANQRFPIFFQEKRPFFLEGVDIFQSPLQVFYSRTIVDPDYAAKLTGKVGKNSFGFLVASDNAPGNYSEAERTDPPIRRFIDEFLDKNAFFAVARVKRDIGKENSVGFFGTARVFPEQRNFTGGFDGRFKLNPKTIVQFQIVGTFSRRCFFDAGFDRFLEPQQADRNQAICGVYLNPRYNYEYRTGNGIGYFWQLDYTEKNRGFLIEASGRSKDYRSDAGFTRRPNTNYLFWGSRLSTEPRPKAKIIRIDWRQGARITYDWQGRSQEATLNSNISISLQHNTFISIQNGINYERLFEEEFGLRRSLTRGGAFFGSPERSAFKPFVAFSFDSTPSKKISFYGYFRNGWNTFDLDFGSGERFPRVSPAALANPSAPLDPGTGRQLDFEAGFTYKPTNPLRISLDYSKSRLTRNDTKRTAFDSDIVSLQSAYQFSRFTFVRGRVDYDSLSSNVRGQVLFGWNPNPGTAFYVGYNDDFNYNGFNPFTGQFEPRFERNNRTFFIRASYLFRKSF